MSVAELLVAIRARASVLSKEPRPPAVEDALVTLVAQARGPSPESKVLARILMGVAEVVPPEATYEVSELDVLNPRVIRRLNLVLEALQDGRCTNQLLRDALRPALARRVP